MSVTAKWAQNWPQRAIETAGIDSNLVAAQDHSWGHQMDRYLDTRLRDFEAQRDTSREAHPMVYRKLADVGREEARPMIKTVEAVIVE